MSRNGVGIGMEDIHPQSKPIRRDQKQARTELSVVGRGAMSRGALVSPTVATSHPPTAATTLVFVS